MIYKNLLLKRTALFTLICLLGFFKSQAQTDVFANELISNSTDFQNPGRVADASKTNYAYISNTLSLLTTSHLRVRFPEYGKAGDVINIQVQGTGDILSTSLLDNITVKLYDSAGSTPVATLTGSSLLQLKLLSPGSNIYAIQFYTNPSATYKFKEARLELANLLSVSLLSQFRVYNFFFQRPCPPVYADKVVDYGSGLLGYVTNAGNVVDANPDNYATMTTLVGLLGLTGSTYIDVTFPIQGKGGDYVGFTVGTSTGLVDLSVLGSLTLVTYDAAGAVKETKSGSSLLDLKLLAGSSTRNTLGFVTAKGSYRISKLRIFKSAAVGLLENLRVYNGFHYTVERPPVTVTTSGPINFCSGGSVTLTAYDSLGATNYLWSTGATSSSITVTTAGTYYVEVTDSFSCTRRSIPIGVTVGITPTPVIKGDSVLCLGNVGTLSLSSTVYESQLWNTGSTATSISNVNAGKYYVSVTDTNGCKGSDTISVIQNKLNVTPTITASTCSNTANGSISLSVTGGSGTYTYRWSTGSTASSITGLKEGIYTCIVSDNVYNCSYNKSFSVTSSNTLSLKMGVVNTSACGKSDGKVTLNVVGGSGTYTYAWSNGGTASTIDNISAGIYKVTVTDGVSSCSISDTVAVGDGGNALVFTPTVTNSSSCSTPNGAISTSVSGGSGTYTYTWSTGATTSGISGLKAGNYYAVVKDVTSGCSKAIMVTVTNSSTLAANATIVAPGCKKQNGSITVASVTGGSGSYSYSWSTGATTSAITGLKAGTYLLTLNDLTSGCSKQEVYTLSDTGGPSATLSITQPDCSSNSNGAITVTAAGTANTYLWSNGATSKSLTSLKPGTYTLTVTDTTTNCTSVYKAVLTIKNQMRINATPSSNTSCASAPNGAIALNITGGLAPFTYSWTGGATTANISNKAAGTYSVSVTDANDCIATLSVTIKTDSTKLLAAALGTITKATCNTATNGGATVTVSGGQTPYTYMWSPGGATTKDLVNVVFGNYTLTVTDALGCTKQVVANITIDSAIALKGKIDSTKASGCATSASGAVYASISGGSAPFTYQWKKGATVVASTLALSGVTAGSYTLTVTDNNGCTVVLNATVPVISTGIVVTADSVKRPTCLVSADGKIYTSVSGGLAPYTYSWSTGETTKDLLNANPGTLILTVTDANGCPGQVTVNLTYDTSKTITVVADSTRGAGCITGKSGAIFITASKGTTPYTYAWSDGSIGSSLNNVVPGTYSVTVTDARGCKVAVTASIGVDTSRSIRGVIDSVEGAGCIGSTSGKIYLTASRGVPPYTYLWSNGATTEDILNAAPGSYTVSIGDAAGCFKSVAASVGVDADKKIIITIDSTRGASCALASNAAIFVTVKGGKAPYKYSWSNGATTSNLTNVQAGIYTLTILDANGCSSELSTTVGVDAAKAIKVTANLIKDAGCEGSASGSISVSVAGGVLPYTYLWSNGATTRDVTALVPGAYSLTVTDFAGCSVKFDATIKVDTANAIKVKVNTVTAAKCTGSSSGSITVTVTGGVAPYAYLWSNGATTKDLAFVSSGAYLLNVTDAIGCTSQLSVNVGIDNSNPVIAKLDSVIAVGCADTLSGKIYVSVNGGVTPYTYLWSNGAATQDLIGVKKGAYKLQVTDNAGCSDDLDVNVETAAPIVLTPTVTPISCNEKADGKIALVASNGSGVYTYKWSDGNELATREGLAAGKYSVTVTDVRTGCNQKRDFELVNPPAISISAAILKDDCLPGADGSITLTVTGGVQPYTYTWSNGGISATINGLAPNTYTVTVKDFNACEKMDTFMVTQPDCDFNVNVHDVITPNGDGKNDLWVIEGIQYYANSVVQVVDKWGDLVFEQRNYANNWYGLNSKTGDQLPSGTYYYVIKLNEANKGTGKDVYTGSMLIQR